MGYIRMKTYLALCGLYGWAPSIRGLLAYDAQEARGLRELWGKRGGEEQWKRS